jgi:hypothetical protein
MTVSTVIIRDKTGTELLSFDPVPQGINFTLDNSPGKMGMDLPGYHRPYMFWSKSSSRKLVIKTVLLGTSYTSQPILDWLNEIMEIMSAQASDYYQIQIPFAENLAGSPKTYDASDSDKDDIMFANGDNYMQFFCHPSGLSIDKLTRNICYITLTFDEVSDVVVIG